jgi:hypothetical protein
MQPWLLSVAERLVRNQMLLQITRQAAEAAVLFLKVR